jgi:hypothetical protein
MLLAWELLYAKNTVVSRLDLRHHASNAKPNAAKPV